MDWGTADGRAKGIALAYLTALVSGISVFANSFGVLTLDATAYTFLKNALVAAILAALCIFFGSWREFATVGRKQLAILAFAWALGGGVAFALFFSGLASAGGAVGSFIYRLLFIFSAIIAVGLMKERLSWNTALGALAILAGNFLLLGDAALGISGGVMMVFGATALWAVEYAVSKMALESLSPTAVGAGRMGIGSLVLLALLLYTGKIGSLAQITPDSIFWIAVSTGFLTLFVTLWYSALKHTSLISATAALTLGGPISALLSLAFAGKALAPAQAAGFFLLAVGAVAAVGAAETASALLWARKNAFARLRL